MPRKREDKYQGIYRQERARREEYEQRAWENLQETGRLLGVIGRLLDAGEESQALDAMREFLKIYGPDWMSAKEKGDKQ